MTIKLTIFALLLMSFPHQQKNVIYVESWKKGKGQIQEQSLTVQLNSAKSKYETRIKDVSGKERFELKLSFIPVQESDKSRTWTGFVELFEIGKQATNLFKPSNDPYQDYFSAKDYIYLLDPLMQGERCKIEDGCMPLFIKRVVKVEDFYCIVQVKEWRSSSMSIEVEFTNKYKGTI